MEKCRRVVKGNAKVCIAVGSGILFVAVLSFALLVSSTGLKQAFSNITHEMVSSHEPFIRRADKLSIILTRPNITFFHFRTRVGRAVRQR